jgi:hypothetical protein
VTARRDTHPPIRRDGGTSSRSTRDPPTTLPNVCRLKVPLPDSAWIAAFSRAHPEARIDVLSRLDIGPRLSLTELRLDEPSAMPWADQLRGLEKVDSVEDLGAGPDGRHFRVVHRTSEFIPIFRELHLMRRFPFTIQGGEALWVVVAPKPTIRKLLVRIQEQAPGASLESIRRESTITPTGTLTARQADLLRQAIAAGYFDVPRKITLMGLAKRLGLAASSLSEALAIGEKKLIEEWPGAGTA